MKKISLIIFLIMTFSWDVAPVKAAYTDWIRPYRGLGGSDFAHDIATDLDDNVYVTGESNGEYPSEKDFLTIKYDSNGNVIWVARYDGTGMGYDTSYKIIVDDFGNVIVAGKSEGESGDSDVLIVKYDSDGMEQWTFRYSSQSILSYDSTDNLTMDSEGNIYTAATVYSDDSSYDAMFMKISPEGNLEWSYLLDSGTSYDDGIDTDVDSDENINFLAKYDSGIYLASFTPEGNLRWEYFSDSGSPVQLGLDTGGNCYIAATAYGETTSFDWHLEAVSSEGSLLWTGTLDGGISGYDFISALDVTDDGEIYLTGSFETEPGNDDIGVAKYNPFGSLEWIYTYNGNGNRNDDGKAIVVYPNGGCVVTGTSYQGPWYLDDAITFKLDVSGVLQWIEEWEPGYGLDNEPAAIAIDSDHNVIITGKDPYDYFTIKYIDEYDTDIELVLTPYSLPMNIPADGGKVRFDAMLKNNTESMEFVDVYLFVILPNGSVYGPVASVNGIKLQSGEIMRNLDISLPVPAAAYSGSYTLQGYAVFAGENTDTSEFVFMKEE